MDTLRSTSNMDFGATREYQHRDGTGTGYRYGIDGDRDGVEGK